MDRKEFGERTKSRIWFLSKFKQLIIGNKAIVVFICTAILFIGVKATPTEKWLAEKNKLINITNATDNPLKSDKDEVGKLIIHPTVSVPKHIDLGDSKKIINEIKNKDGKFITSMVNEKTILLFGGPYSVNYEIGQGYTGAVDLSKSGISFLGEDGLNFSDSSGEHFIDGSHMNFLDCNVNRYYSPSRNYIFCVDYSTKKIYLVDVRKSSVTEININLESVQYKWSDNERYFVISGYTDSGSYAYAGEINNNGAAKLVSYIEASEIKGISNEGDISSNDKCLRKIDNTERIDSKDIKVVGDDELNAFDFKYYFMKDKILAITERSVNDKEMIYICELKGREARVANKIQLEDSTGNSVVVEDDKSLKFYRKKEVVSISLEDLNITKEKADIDDEYHEKGFLSPNYYSYIDNKIYDKLTIKKSSDDSILLSLDIPINEANFKYINNDELIVMKTNVSLKDFKILKVNVKTKKIEEIR